MSDMLILGILTLIGTLSGTFSGIIVASRLTAYRLEQLEKKVDKHNSMIDRMYCAEQHLSVVDEKLKVVNHRLDNAERRQ